MATIKCDEPGCVNGKITLFSSVKNCPKCNGTGQINVVNNQKETVDNLSDNKQFCVDSLGNVIWSNDIW